MNIWGCSPFYILCCDGATGVGRAAVQLSRSRWEVTDRAFLVFECWQIPPPLGYSWRDVLMMEENGLSCWAEFSYFFNSCGKKKPKTNQTLQKAWCFLGLFFVCFMRAQIKATKAVWFSKRRKSSSQSVKHPGVVACFPSDLGQVRQLD